MEQNVAQVKAKEIESNNSVQILEVVLKIRNQVLFKTIPFAEYMFNFKSMKGKFEVIDQIKSLPSQIKKNIRISGSKELRWRWWQVHI